MYDKHSKGSDIEKKMFFEKFFPKKHDLKKFLLGDSPKGFRIQSVKSCAFNIGGIK
jgi:hypothetical protein